MDKYNDAAANLREMIDTFQDDLQFRLAYSHFLNSAASTLEYVKKRYYGRVNTNGGKFEDWFRNKGIKKLNGNEELTFLDRARGHDYHSGHVPTGATRGASYAAGLTLVSSEKAVEQANSTVTNPSKEESEVETEETRITTFSRWLVDEDDYMYYNAYGKTYDSRNYIPTIRSRYPITGNTNQIDIIQLSMAQLNKIKNIIDDCQRDWP